MLFPATASQSSPMAQLALHHVTLVVTDLPRSVAFYQRLFGLTIIERPPFKSVGAWLASGTLQVHLTLYPPGSFRTGNIDNDDCHFAFRTDDFRRRPRHADCQRFSRRCGGGRSDADGGKDSGKKHTDCRITPRLAIKKDPGAVPTVPAFD